MIDEKFELITTEILSKNGFECINSEDETQFWKDEIGVKDFSEWEKHVKGYWISMRKGICNTDNEWCIQIDNELRESAGAMDITYTWQFDSVMEILLSPFRLKI